MVPNFFQKEIHLCRKCRIPHIVIGYHKWQKHLRQVKWKERAKREMVKHPEKVKRIV